MRRALAVIAAALVATPVAANTMSFTVERVDTEMFKTRPGGQAKATLKFSEGRYSDVTITCAFLSPSGAVLATGSNGIPGQAGGSYASILASIPAGAVVSSADCTARAH